MLKAHYPESAHENGSDPYMLEMTMQSLVTQAIDRVQETRKEIQEQMKLLNKTRGLPVNHKDWDQLASEEKENQIRKIKEKADANERDLERKEYLDMLAADELERLQNMG